MKSLPWDMIGAIFGGLSFLLTLIVEWNKLGIWRRIIIALVIGISVFIIIKNIPTIFPPPPPITLTPTTIPTTVPISTSTPVQLPTKVVTALYDDFNDSTFDGKWNPNLWLYSSNGYTSIEQQNGILTLSRQERDNGGLYASKLSGINEIKYVEAKLKLDGNIQASGGDIGIGINDGWWINCSIFNVGRSAYGRCATNDNYATDSVQVAFNTWHTMHFEIDPNAKTVSFFFDGQPIGTYDRFGHTQFSVNIAVFSGDGGLVTGYIDDVKIWK